MSERIPTTKPSNFIPKSIVHVILTVDRTKLATDPQLAMNLAFTVQAPAPTTPTMGAGDETEVEKYALARAGFQAVDLLTTPAPSPFDIDVREQCWVVVELDSKIHGWQFAKHERGATTKGESDRNCYLRHVYAKGVEAPGERIPRDGCRVLYFGVVARDVFDPKKDPNPGSEAFNFHTEFLMEENDPNGVKIKKRLNVIFDPDVKNDGGKFPP
ncbi:hypothetical protein ASD21_00425 [Caulobacter sp. Root1455]|uniref:nucleotide synthetase n=1 Tax=Caulobacter sp. Root1455 TaxID=1736465 RepID=UPI0006F67F64|nr:nucleotide synthetase [Caulobacter sp. Root1455]KQZ06143.1 hypothetical protein ASD21_00425 [Caulobacter sp. Root1455]